jgi:phosphoribosylamine--glycine ligase
VPIDGLADATAVDGVVLFHAGTRTEGDSIVTAGGRVLAVSATGDSFGDARTRAYEAASRIRFEGKHVRADIAARAQDYEEAGT